MKYTLQDWQRSFPPRAIGLLGKAPSLGSPLLSWLSSCPRDFRDSTGCGCCPLRPLRGRRSVSIAEDVIHFREPRIPASPELELT